MEPQIVSADTPFRRRLLFRTLAIGLGILPFAVAEVVCVIGGWGSPELQTDPYVGFASQRPLFVKSESGDRYEIAANRYLCFQPDSFEARKADHEFRVFCLGGSTVQGRPFSIETSFTTWLELSLQARDPERSWRVVNCGGVSYASYRLVPILQEILSQYEPDLILVYTGHNEFLEDRTYDQLKRQPMWLKRMVERAMRWRIFNVVRRAITGWKESKSDSDDRADSLLPEEVATRLDYEGGLAKFVRDPTWQAGVVQHLTFNLERMLQLCKEANVPCWLVDPIYNLRDCPPFKSAHRERLTGEEKTKWLQLRGEAGKLYSTNMSTAIRRLEEARRIDNQHAGLHYDLGKAYEATHQYEKSLNAYLRAKDLDICPLRATEPVVASIRTAADRFRVPLIPVHRVFHERSRHGIPGDRLMADHVHPSVQGHTIVAELLVDQFVESELVGPPPSRWEDRRDKLYKQHTQSLPTSYYLRGRQILEQLRAWSRGRASVWP